MTESDLRKHQRRSSADLLDLAARQRWRFVLVLAPPRIIGTTGLAVNPSAIC